jgi:Concanavalin A-like lectin/glucanases superfamily
MVLSRSIVLSQSHLPRPGWGLVGLLLLSAGCSQSLFDEGKTPDGSGGSGAVGVTCPADCLADAARDFADVVGGSPGPWRFVDDLRNRSWAPMTVDAGRLVGADASQSVAACSEESTAPSCVALPGALLVSTGLGAGSGADPAIEFTSDAQRSVQLSARVFVPADAVRQQVLIYRNSREDLLFAGEAMPGEMFEQALAADVITGDRLLVALAPASGDAADIGVEVFISDVGETSKCQVTLDFAAAASSSITNRCGAGYTSYDYDNGDTAITPTTGPGPFPELGTAAVITPGKYYKGTERLDKSRDVTIQFWMKLVSIDTIYVGYPFSDHDLDSGGGVSIDVYDGGGTVNLESLTPVDITRNPPTYAGSGVPFARYAEWNFVRISQAGAKVSVCINGKPVMTYDVPVGKLNSGYLPHLGMNVRWGSRGAFINGSMDDFRVLSAALPCQ